MIPVTKPYLPSREKLDRYIDGIYERQWLTNNGSLVQELTRRLEEYLGVENLLLVSNGTLALQIAYRALGISGGGAPAEAITTPFTFVATASSLKWEGVDPVFVDIDDETWCLDPGLVESAITPRTRAIVPVHVFGNACDVEAIDKLGRQHGLKVVYDASHAFGVTYKGESLLKHGDAATLSFHATKLFHTVEGGAIVFKRKEDLERARKMINFGITGPETIEEIGINAKMNEFQAAMGLCVLDEMEDILQSRKASWSSYEQKLKGRVIRQRWASEATNNHAYFPLVLHSESDVKRVMENLSEESIQARRYFYPSLETVDYLSSAEEMTISHTVAKRVLCLPLYVGLDVEKVLKVAGRVIPPTVINDFSSCCESQLVGFIQRMDKFFKPAIGARADLNKYVQKLKANGIVLGSVDSSQQVTSLVGFYANDTVTRTAFITYVAVDPELQGKQVAKTLVKQAMTLSALKGMKLIKVSTWAENVGALKVYKNLGFEEIERQSSEERTTVFLEAKL